MRNIFTLFFMLLLSSTTLPAVDDTMVTSTTTILPVEAIEPSAKFFEKIGFKRESAVKDDSEALVFIIMNNGKAQVMLQSKAGLVKDSDAFKAAAQTTPVLLYMVVADVEAVAKALSGHQVTMEMRETFYGSIEIAFTEPGGHLITFAEFKSE